MLNVGFAIADAMADIEREEQIEKATIRYRAALEASRSIPSGTVDNPQTAAIMDEYEAATAALAALRNDDEEEA